LEKSPPPQLSTANSLSVDMIGMIKIARLDGYVTINYVLEVIAKGAIMLDHDKTFNKAIEQYANI
jgi:hypothetical protein